MNRENTTSLKGKYKRSIIKVSNEIYFFRTLMNLLQPLILFFLSKYGEDFGSFRQVSFYTLIEQFFWELILDWSTLFRRYGPGTARVKPYKRGVNLHGKNCPYVFWPYYEATHEVRLLPKKRMTNESTRGEYTFFCLTTNTGGGAGVVSHNLVLGCPVDNLSVTRLLLSTDFEFFLVPLTQPFPARLEDWSPERLDSGAPRFPIELLPYSCEEGDFYFPYFDFDEDEDTSDSDSESEEDKPKAGENIDSFYESRIDALQAQIKKLSKFDEEYKPEKDDKSFFYKSYVAALKAKIEELEEFDRFVEYGRINRLDPEL